MTEAQSVEIKSAIVNRLDYEPRTAANAMQFCKWVCSSGFYSNIKRPEQGMMILAQGKELGLSAMQSLNMIAVVSGKPTISAQAMLALVQRSGEADYVKRVELTDKKAIYKTHRKGDPDPDPVLVEFTIEDAKAMNLTGKDNWKKQPKTMLKWRAVAALCREVYPDIISGIYATEEMDGVEMPPPEPVKVSNPEWIEPSNPEIISAPPDVIEKVREAQDAPDLVPAGFNEETGEITPAKDLSAEEVRHNVDFIVQELGPEIFKSVGGLPKNMKEARERVDQFLPFAIFGDEAEDSKACEA